MTDAHESDIVLCPEDIQLRPLAWGVVHRRPLYANTDVGP